ncbi:hypothetical protein MSM1_08160 [Mycobacterium sp. SM1]|uniref:hypothetical protein n=1 Tax=Mycobacterium sp. SM1 TaxID=2816243 RepID=UPI001BCBC006|nr:hypothetical protein [Mycobacterium sp. SM1]MBS4728318.1 hypothetical protein [Mycobacterium sp. SM1]
MIERTHTPLQPAWPTSARLNTAEINAATRVLRALVEHRDDLVKTRTQTANRRHVVLTNLIAGGADQQLTAKRAAALLCSVNPRDGAGQPLRALATDLISEIPHLDRRIAKAARISKPPSTPPGPPSPSCGESAP